ncbi:hypothetical protein Vretimale_10669 [Volvox reticuliferus]|uniref:Box C/D snoRNA protein 1 n=1 Tax=Volvox reticuliferus TaxID=1737510 RepID=A0A8J4GG20_9CHLO|nr:hypothetical protein Vretifemale_13926 [Volvox reticuliferus]GIM06332.1 hypothetical protein Vretimale_10669 [Volvox reticuliferus]
MDTETVAAAPMPLLPYQNAAATSTPVSSNGHESEPAVQGTVGVEEQEERRRAQPPAAPLCEHCGAAPSKYRCPGCQRRSCSLECVRAHKASTGCSGQRIRTAFVSMQEFDDRALMSDFRLLEEIGRADDVARRCRPPASKQQLPPYLGSLVYQASRRSVKLLLMPPGMAKRTSNTTRYDARKRTMFWRVEWRFPAANMDCVNERVDEESVLGEVLSAHLRRPAVSSIPLRLYAKAGLDQLRVFMRKEKTPANQAAFFPIDISRPLASQLESRTVIEYPVFIVALPHEAALYPPPAMLAPPPRPAKPPAVAVPDAAQRVDVVDVDGGGGGGAAAVAAAAQAPTLAGGLMDGARPMGQWAAAAAAELRSHESRANSADGAGAPCGSPVAPAAGSRNEAPLASGVQLHAQGPHPLSGRDTAVAAASAAGGAVAMVAGTSAGTESKGSLPAPRSVCPGAGNGLVIVGGSGSGDTAGEPPFKRQRVAVEAAGGGTGAVGMQSPGLDSGCGPRSGPAHGSGKVGSSPLGIQSAMAAVGWKEAAAGRDENEIELADEDGMIEEVEPGRAADLAGGGAAAGPKPEGAEAVGSCVSEGVAEGGGGQGAGHVSLAAAAAAAAAAKGGDADTSVAAVGGGGTAARSVIQDGNEIELDDEMEA